jgi:hypothetical protein
MDKLAQHDSNVHQIKEQLLAGRRITVRSILKSVGTPELRHYIPIIRRRFDIDIATEWVTRNGKRFKEYFLRKQEKAA